MKLIQEITEEVSLLLEDVSGKKRHIIKGRFAVSEEVNKNGRMYPKSVLENAVNKYIKEKVENQTSYGELDHPTGPKINSDRISHLIEELTWDNNVVMGKAVVLNTPMGQIAKAIMDGGGRLGVSTRGLGSLKENAKGIQEVQNDLHFSTIADLVTNPSGPSCWVNGIMENTEYYYDAENQTYAEKVSNVVKEVHKLSKRQLEENSFKLFKNFLNEIQTDITESNINSIKLRYATNHASSLPNRDKNNIYKRVLKHLNGIWKPDNEDTKKTHEEIAKTAARLQ